jgi:hypothetical protein
VLHGCTAQHGCPSGERLPRASDATKLSVLAKYGQLVLLAQGFRDAVRQVTKNRAHRKCCLRRQASLLLPDYFVWEKRPAVCGVVALNLASERLERAEVNGDARMTPHAGMSATHPRIALNNPAVKTPGKFRSPDHPPITEYSQYNMCLCPFQDGLFG